MRIAFVHASGIRNSRFIEERGASLLDRGHNVAFLGWNRYHDQPYTFRSAYVRRFNVPTPLNSSAYFLLIPLWWVWIFIRLLKYHPHTVICINADAVPVCLLYTKLARKTLVHDLHDFYYYHFAHMPAPIPQIVDMITCAAIRHSQLVLSISKEAIDDFFSRHCSCADWSKTKIYPCLPTPMERSALPLQKIQRYEEFTACYFGNIARNRHVYEILDAMYGLPSCRFLLAGPEMEKGALSECLTRIQACRNMDYLGYLMRDELLERTARSHCVILPLEPDNLHHRIPLPNKVYEGIICHTPVITTEGTSSAEKVRRYGMGVIIPDNSPPSIRDAVRSLSEDRARWESCVEGCKRAEHDIISRYDYTATINAIEGAGRR